MNSDLSLVVGDSATIRGQKFFAVGRIEFFDGFMLWSEICLRRESDGATAWLELDDGQLLLMQKERLASVVPPFSAIGIGEVLAINGSEFFVTEKCRARVSHVGGNIPFAVKIDDEVSFADGVMNGAPASLEFNASGIELVVGQTVSASDIALGS